MPVTAEQVKALRAKTGAGIMECKAALESAGGDEEKAMAILRERGYARAAKKAERAAEEGLIGSYIHVGGKIGVLVEINCETDFVARNQEFQELVRDIAMQIAWSNPAYIRKEDIPPEELDRLREEFRREARASNAPQQVIENIVEGKLAKFYAEKVLYEQPFIRDAGITIEQLLMSKIAKIGENIKVSRFARFKIGE